MASKLVLAALMASASQTTPNLTPPLPKLPPRVMPAGQRGKAALQYAQTPAAATGNVLKKAPPPKMPPNLHTPDKKKVQDLEADVATLTDIVRLQALRIAGLEQRIKALEERTD